MYLSTRSESDPLFASLSSREQWLCFCAGQNVGSCWPNSATVTVSLQESYMDRTWDVLQLSVLLSLVRREPKYFLMKVQGDFYITWILWLDHQNYPQGFHLLLRVGRATDWSTGGMNMQLLCLKVCQEGLWNHLDWVKKELAKKHHHPMSLKDKPSTWPMKFQINIVIVWLITALFAGVVVISHYKISTLIG